MFQGYYPLMQKHSIEYTCVGNLLENAADIAVENGAVEWLREGINHEHKSLGIYAEIYLFVGIRIPSSSIFTIINKPH